MKCTKSSRPPAVPAIGSVAGHVATPGARGARRPFIAAILAAMLLPVGAVAQEEPPEGCFCLAEAGRTLPQVIRGCTGEKFPNRFFWHAVCRSIDESGTEVVTDPIMITEEWTILPMGHEKCPVCEPERRDGPIVPRGEGGDEEAE